MPYSTSSALTVTVALAAVALASVTGITVIACLDKPIPPSLAATAGAAIGALGGHLGAMGYRRNGEDGRSTILRG